MKENSIIKIVVGKYENEILIKVKNNIVIFKLKDISKIVKHEFNTIDNSYEYFNVCPTVATYKTKNGS
jgi:hypothetical protein